MKILLVEDDLDTATMIKSGLTADAHTVEIAADGGNGSFMGRNYEFDAIVLDYSLPKKDGLVVCKEVRAAGKTTPILFLSVTDDIDSKVSALNNGADDYVTKPFSFEELYARIKAVTRRPSTMKLSVFQVDSLIMDVEKHTVTRSGKNVQLTRKEFCLLEYFMRHVGIILSRAILMEHVWSAESDPYSNTVEAHIRNLRKKITLGGVTPNLIANVPGRGYIMDVPNNLPEK